MKHLADRIAAPGSPGPLEKAVLIHVGLLAVLSTWAFGGNAVWARSIIMSLTAFAPVLSLWFVLTSRQRGREGRRVIQFLWPLWLFGVVVIASCFNPSFRAVVFEQDTLYIHEGARFGGFPSTVNPRHTLDALWFFGGIYWAAFNLLLIVRQRRALRTLLLVLGINVVVLAIFGTLQKLASSSGLYFGLQPSPQPSFFATFIYHNHWGAHAVLMTGAMLGLIFHQWRNQSARDFFHSPVFAGVLSVLLLAASIPLSSSRSCSLLISLFLLAAVFHAAKNITATARSARGWRVTMLLVVVLSAAGAIYFLGRPVIDARIDKTFDQVAAIRASSETNSRLVLYQDTWRMAQDKPAFGWGMGSYALIFQNLYNSQRSVDRLPLIYIDAHSDWLQAFSELGFVGVALLALTLIIPLAQLRRRHFQSPLIVYLLGGCALVLLYAAVEFPFGNGSVVIVFWLCLFTAVQYARLRDRAGSSS